MKKFFENIIQSFLGHETKNYFKLPETEADLPDPPNDTPWAGAFSYSVKQFNKITRKGGHGSPAFYATVGFILAAITLIEFGVFYYKSLGALLAPILLILSLLKFVMVVGFFMHLRFDNKLFTLVFIAGFILAVAISFILLILLAVKPYMT